MINAKKLSIGKKNGKTKSQIAKILSIARGCVRYKIKKHVEHGFVEDLKRLKKKSIEIWLKFKRKIPIIWPGNYSTLGKLKNPSLSTVKYILFTMFYYHIL